MELIFKGEGISIDALNKRVSALTLDEFFEFIEEHFIKLHEFTYLQSFMPFVHLWLEMWTQSEEYFNNDIGIVLFCILEQHLDEESDFAIVIQIVHHILYNVKGFTKNQQIQISKKVFVHLAELLTTIKNRQLVSNIIACLQLYMNMYPDCHQEIIQILWSGLSQRLVNTSCIQSINIVEIDILLQFFDEFHEINPFIQEDPKIIATIQQLLLSDKEHERKCGYFLFKKMLYYLLMRLENLDTVWLTTGNNEFIEQLWTSYIHILQSLDEAKSNILMSSLKPFANLVESKQLQSSWLEILYVKLLTHKNIDVLYCAVHFFLESFIISDLSENVVKELFKASNSTLLYNYEGHFLNQKLFSSFVKGNLTKVLVMLSEMDWESIPLYVWIKALNDNEKEISDISISYEQVIKISSKVCALKNSVICERAVYLVNYLFKNIINNMPMAEYVTYIETLHSTTNYFDLSKLYDTKSYCIKKIKEDFVFKQNIYKAFLKDISDYNPTGEQFITLLKDIPQQHHGWLKFIPFHYLDQISNESIKVLNNFHGMDINYLRSCKLMEIINKFEQNLKPELLPSDYEQEAVEHCRFAAIAFYMQQKETLDDEDDETLKIIFNSETSKNNLPKIFSKLWKQLFECLRNTIKTLSTSIFDEFLKNSTHCDADSILQYLSKTYDDDTKNEYYEIILEKYPHAFYFYLDQYINPLKLSNQERFFNSQIKKDELRIEQLFTLHTMNRLTTSVAILNTIWISGLNKYCDEEYILYLLNFHEKLTVKNPIYDENSNEYYIKTRIAFGILSANDEIKSNSDICDKIWNILLNEYNHLIICYAYEYFLGIYEKRENLILKKLKDSHSLASNQQIAIMSVTYTFCMANNIENIATIKEVVLNLHALTMCDNSETRLFAKLFLYELLKSEKFENNLINSKEFQQIIETGMQTKLNEYLFDIRLLMYKITQIYSIIAILLFVTKHQFDPFFGHASMHYIFNGYNCKPEISKSRNLYLKNKTSATESKTCLNDQLELYNLPKQHNIIKPNNLIIYPKEEDSNCKIIVVACLIDNLSTLSALARNCKLLGITNLIINTKNLIKEKNICENLNKSAGNSLNIMDIESKDLKCYLINKQQLEDYKIVASEETSNREEVTNFKFPQKCILLLGHEKYGLTVSLSGVIDHTFKVSQLYRVHALNVQETGIFCMWKYYEQHLINKI